MKAKYLFFVLLFVLSFAADQGTKIWARNTLKPEGYPTSLVKPGTVVPVKTVIKGFWEFRYSENRGSAFGMFRDLSWARTMLFIIGLVCLGVIGMWLYRVPDNAAWLAGKLGLLAGGAVGNIFDRVRFGKVTDFILWQITSDGKPLSFTVPVLNWHIVTIWPTFNVADAALVIGVISILIDWPRDRLPVEPEQTASSSSKDSSKDAAKEVSKDAAKETPKESDEQSAKS